MQRGGGGGERRGPAHQRCQTPKTIKSFFGEIPECVVAPRLLPLHREGSSQRAVDPAGGPSRACCHSACWRRKRPRVRPRSPESRGRASLRWSSPVCCSSTGGSLVRRSSTGSASCSCCSGCSRCLALDPALVASLALSCSLLSEWSYRRTTKYFSYRS